MDNINIEEIPSGSSWVDLQIDNYHNSKEQVFVVTHRPSGIKVQNSSLIRAVSNIKDKIREWEQITT